jgi:hypothetical protein
MYGTCDAKDIPGSGHHEDGSEEMPRYDTFRSRGGRGASRPYDEYAGGYAGPRGGHTRYDRDFGRYFTPVPGAAGYPSARWGWGPIGWAAWGPGMELSPFAGVPYHDFGEPYPPRRRPEESPTYGRGGDRAVRRWASRYGYDEGYEIHPRRRGR